MSDDNIREILIEVSIALGHAANELERFVLKNQLEPYQSALVKLESIITGMALEHKPDVKKMKCKDEDISNIHELRSEVAKYFLQSQRFSKANDDLKERLENSRIFQEKQQAEISEISIDKEILLIKIDKLLAGTGFQTIDDYIEAMM